MKKTNSIEFSAIDLAFMVRELKMLEGAKIQRIYQDAPDDFSFILYHNKAKPILRIHFPCVWMSTSREPTHKQTSQFCIFLRRRLENGRIETINQKENERILELVVRNRQESFYIMVELFGDGNIVLCDCEQKIIGAMITRSWATRTIRKGKNYELPGREDTKEEEKEQENQLQKQEKTSWKTISQYAAIALGGGKQWSLELCARAEIDPRSEWTEEKAEKLNETKEKILEENIQARIVDGKPLPIKLTTIKQEQVKNNKKDSGKDKLEENNKEKNKQEQEMPSFSAALENIFSEKKSIDAESEDNREAKKNKVKTKKEKLESAIAIQKKTAKKHMESAAQAERKGQLLYERYETIAKLLQTVKEKHKNLEEIKDKKIEGIKIIEINQKEKNITIEIEE